jgi:transcriptional regulator of arginine metabolism
MSDRSTRVRRQASIRELVRDRRVQSQDELVELLLARGVAVTQSTLSRDLRELRIARVPYADGYRYVEAADGDDGNDASIETRRLLATIAPIEVVEVLANEVSVVVRTLPGRAQGVAALIDRLGVDEVLATLAGDDTVLVIPRTVRAVDALRVRLAAALGLA